ncbi:hypothetical protein [Streptomyces massasporeus]|uniref:hypothetical protein n=1 Tax=Streptomyces massasporeus TaxID=67324 RepID=UPI0034023558
MASVPRSLSSSSRFSQPTHLLLVARSSQPTRLLLVARFSSYVRPPAPAHSRPLAR